MSFGSDKEALLDELDLDISLKLDIGPLDKIKEENSPAHSSDKAG